MGPTDRHRDTINIGGLRYRKFVPYPEPIEDGTIRCIFCGQIDEPVYHDDRLCPACTVQTKEPTT